MLFTSIHLQKFSWPTSNLTAASSERSTTAPQIWSWSFEREGSQSSTLANEQQGQEEHNHKVADNQKKKSSPAERNTSGPVGADREAGAARWDCSDLWNHLIPKKERLENHLIPKTSSPPRSWRQSSSGSYSGCTSEVSPSTMHRFAADMAAGFAPEYRWALKMFRYFWGIKYLISVVTLTATWKVSCFVQTFSPVSSPEQSGVVMKRIGCLSGFSMIGQSPPITCFLQ